MGLYELKTNPFWRQQITPQDIWQHVRDLDQRMNNWFNRQANDVMREVSEWVMNLRGKLTEQAGAVVAYAMRKQAELNGDVNCIIASVKHRNLEDFISS